MLTNKTILLNCILICSDSLECKENKPPKVLAKKWSVMEMSVISWICMFSGLKGGWLLSPCLRTVRSFSLLFSPVSILALFLVFFSYSSRPWWGHCFSSMSWPLLSYSFYCQVQTLVLRMWLALLLWDALFNSMMGGFSRRHPRKQRSWTDKQEFVSHCTLTSLSPIISSSCFGKGSSGVPWLFSNKHPPAICIAAFQVFRIYRTKQFLKVSGWEAISLYLLYFKTQVSEFSSHLEPKYFTRW
jgi:hypothetical protein